MTPTTRAIWGPTNDDEALPILTHAVLGYQQSKMWFDIGNNASSAHMDAELEMKQEQLDDAVINYMVRHPELLEKFRIGVTIELVETRRAHGCNPGCVHRGGKL